MVLVRWVPEPQNSDQHHDQKFHREIMQSEVHSQTLSLLSKVLVINPYQNHSKVGSIVCELQNLLLRTKALLNQTYSLNLTMRSYCSIVTYSWQNKNSGKLPFRIRREIAKKSQQTLSTLPLNSRTLVSEDQFTNPM